MQELQEQLVNYQHLGVPSNALARERTQTSVPFSESKSRYESEMIASLNKKNEELDSENKKLAHELGLLIEQAADLYEKNFLVSSFEICLILHTIHNIYTHDKGCLISKMLVSTTPQNLEISCIRISMVRLNIALLEII